MKTTCLARINQWVHICVFSGILGCHHLLATHECVLKTSFVQACNPSHWDDGATYWDGSQATCSFNDYMNCSQAFRTAVIVFGNDKWNVYFLLFVSRLISSIYTYNFMTIIDFCTYDEHRKRTCIVDSSNISFVPAHNLPNVSRQMIDTYPVSSPFKYSSDIAKYFRSLVVFHLLEYVDFIPVVWIS